MFAHAAEKVMYQYGENFPMQHESEQLCGRILELVKRVKFMVLKKGKAAMDMYYLKGITSGDVEEVASSLHKIDTEFLKSLTMADFFGADKGAEYFDF